jgi:hypothetical protein
MPNIHPDGDPESGEDAGKPYRRELRVLRQAPYTSLPPALRLMPLQPDFAQAEESQGGAPYSGSHVASAPSYLQSERMQPSTFFLPSS